MASCSICGTAIPTNDIVQGKYKKRDGQAVCLKCDSVSVPRPNNAAKAGALTGATGATRSTAAPPSRTGGPRPAAPASSRPEPEGRTPRTRGSFHARAPQNSGPDKVTKIAMIVGGILFLSAGITIFAISSKHSREANERQERLDRSKQAVERVKSFIAKDTENFEAILSEIDTVAASKAVIPESGDETELNNLRADTVSRRQQTDFRKSNIEMYNVCEKDADNFAKMDETLKKIEALVEASRSMDEAFLQKVNVLSLKIHTNAVKAAEQNLQDYVQANPNNLKGILDQFRTALNKLEDMKKQGGEVGKLANAKSKELRTQEDEWAVKYYNEVAERTAWTDLLDQNNRGKWFSVPSKLSNNPLALSFDGGKMNAKSTLPPGERERATMLSGKKDYWIDFDIEMEVEIKSAGFVVLGRYSGPQNFFQLTCETGGEGNPIVEGQTYKIRIQALGRETNMFIEGVELAASKFTIPPQAKSGALGFGINPGGEVIFHKLRARIVRAE